MAWEAYLVGKDGKPLSIGAAKGITFVDNSGRKTYLSDPAEVFECELSADDRLLLAGMKIEPGEV